jgi:hypothetical protein
LLPKAAAEEVSRVVRRFALVLVAGRLAWEAGVLPFPPAVIEKAVPLVLKRWLDVHGWGPMERAVEQLRDFLLRKDARIRDRHEDAGPPVRDLVGNKDSQREL